jgi:hypothetical protein
MEFDVLEVYIEKLVKSLKCCDVQIKLTVGSCQDFKLL